MTRAARLITCLDKGRVITLAVGLLWCVAASPLRAEKTDSLVMQNGNEITGEVKSLDQGQLKYSTDDLGILSVNWDRVASIVSKKSVLVEMEDGARYVGVMEKPVKANRRTRGQDPKKTTTSPGKPGSVGRS